MNLDIFSNNWYNGRQSWKLIRLEISDDIPRFQYNRNCHRSILIRSQAHVYVNPLLANKKFLNTS